MPTYDMKYLILLSYIAVCSAFLFGTQYSADGDAYNLCVYSKDVSKYTPNCYTCLAKVYLQSLLACVNATTMPSNITYDSATCMEKNCAINYPTPKPAALEKASILDAFSKFLSMTRMTRSIFQGSPSDGTIENEVPQSFKIIGNINTFASDFTNIELDYQT